MARRKVVLVIVEGLSDEQALSIILTRYHKKYSQNLLVKVMFGDITTAIDYNAPSKNMREKITDAVKDHAKTNKLRKDDYEQVIHLIDMDGAFVDDSYILERPELSEPLYTTDSIKCKKKEDIIKRNIQKVQNLKEIMRLKKIWTVIDYKAYYMSCNLDHVLYGLQNCTDEEKEQRSFNFADRYKDDIDGFIAFVSESDFSVHGSYAETWDFIQRDLRSLCRYTNLGLHFTPPPSV